MVEPRAAAHDPPNLVSSIECLPFPVVRVIGIHEVRLLPVRAPEAARPFPNVAAHLFTAVGAEADGVASGRAGLSDGRLDIGLVRVERVVPGIGALRERVRYPRPVRQRRQHFSELPRCHPCTVRRHPLAAPGGLLPLRLRREGDDEAPRQQPSPCLAQEAAKAERFGPAHVQDRVILPPAQAALVVRRAIAELHILPPLRNGHRETADEVRGMPDRPRVGASRRPNPDRHP